MKIALACSAGGHLTELLQLEEAWKGEEIFFVTDARAKEASELSGEEKVHWVWVPRRNFLQLLVNVWQSFWIWWKERPDAVVTTGADVAVPLCLISKFFGAKLVYIESFARIDEPSLSGKILQAHSDLFLVQWPSMLKYFQKAKFVGSVF